MLLYKVKTYQELLDGKKDGSRLLPLSEKINCDLSNLEKRYELMIVSFKLEVLDKYYGDSNYQIRLNNEVGTLDSNNPGWQLQIDVHENCGYVNIWLYQLGNLPEEEQQHFVQHNIQARELSQTAHRRWLQGNP